MSQTRDQVAGESVPVGAEFPYWTTQVLTEQEADDVYFAVVGHYHNRALSRVYSNNGTGSEVNLAARYTHYYPMSVLPNHEDVSRRCTEAVNRCSAEWFHKSPIPVYDHQILGYEEKCQFGSHCDNSIWQNNRWVRNDPLRDITSLLYIGECVETQTRPNQYSGGELVFTNIVDANGEQLRLRPKKGQLIVFPSHPEFTHMVTPVSRGYRIALVNWWTLR